MLFLRVKFGTFAIPRGRDRAQAKGQVPPLDSLKPAEISHRQLRWSEAEQELLMNQHSSF